MIIQEIINEIHFKPIKRLALKPIMDIERHTFRSLIFYRKSYVPKA